MFNRKKGSEEPHNTRKMIAAMAETSESAVQRIEKIWKVADEEMKEALLKGDMKVNTAHKKLFGAPGKKLAGSGGAVAEGSADTIGSADIESPHSVACASVESGQVTSKLDKAEKNKEMYAAK